jgi:thioredoxin reductase (NADPH)
MAGKKITEIESTQWQDHVLDQKVAVVDFYSTECPPCEALAPKYDGLSELYGDDIHFVKIFRQGNRELAEKLDVTSSPTVLFYKDGEITGDRLTGGIKRSDIMSNLDELVDGKRADEIRGEIKQVETETDVVVLGGGPAGLTAGIYLAQAHVRTIVVDIALPGGYVTTTHQVSNYPGFIEPQNGFMLSHYMSEQAKQNGVEFRAAVEISSVDLAARTVVLDGFETIRAKRIIIATGSHPRPLNVPGEKEFGGQGISYCATCDGKYYEGKDIVVVGGGNSAIEETLFLARFAKSITVVHQFDELQANKVAQKRIFGEKKVKFLFSHEPRAFKKYGTMDMGVVVENLKTKEETEIRTDGVFVFVGFVPNLDGFGSDLKLDEWGYLAADDDMRTNLDGIYAIGDVKTKAYRQITTAVADGTIAAIAISKELD